METKSFIQQVVRYVMDAHSHQLLNIWIVWPNKRAGLFFLNTLKSQFSQASFSPKILTIQDFATDMSELRLMDSMELGMEFYEVYKSIVKNDETESFEQFTSWASMLLQDFDEIDNNLSNPKEVFGYLKNIKDIDHWSQQLDQSNTLKESYMKRWENLWNFYKSLQQHLLQKKQGYRGLIYKQAASKVQGFLTQNTDVQIVFAGFNAFTKAQEKIVFDVLEAGHGVALWDVDSYFMQDVSNETGKFFRRLQNMPYYKTHPFLWENDYFRTAKKIQSVAVSKNIGQVKYVGNLLKEGFAENQSQTAIILANENLLEPLLNAIPESITAANITMGLPLQQLGVAQFFKHIFKIHAFLSEGNMVGKEFYYKDVFSICDLLNGITQLGAVKRLQEQITKNNLVFLTPKSVTELTDLSADKEVVQLIFSAWEVTDVLDNFKRIIQLLKGILLKSKSDNSLNTEYLFHFHEIFNKLDAYQSRYAFLKDIKTLNRVFSELVKTQKLSFSGEPLEGIQIMGLLESRNLDFGRVIMLGANEGFMPTKPDRRTLLPLEVRLAFGLPTYKEADAIFAYHFYRLVCRASEMVFIYNTDTESFGTGEMSRFLLQLKLDSPHQVQEITIGNTAPVAQNPLKSIEKTAGIIQLLKQRALSGFSPTVLTNYILNPFKFYEQFVLKVYEEKQVEENVELRTLGDIVHHSLEAFYKPYENKHLSLSILDEMLQNIEPVVRVYFEKNLQGGKFDSGKNLIVFYVAQKFVENLIKIDRRQLEKGNQIKILQTERTLATKFDLPHFEFPILLKGTVDRIDEVDGQIRIVDYKTGKVELPNLEIVEWDRLREDFKYSKAFQVLFYAYLLDKCDHVQLPVKAGIISFKNLSAGFMPFAVKDKTGRGAIKEHQIDADVLKTFESLLTWLLKEIYDPSIPLTEKLAP
ncbi:MAG: hypothetical protein CO119_00420 [Flavobacteriales bacterium CG_4_9_14_3_um_filter_40_17]|nr:MAG: hypothetical protein CO119_00420 [Flavobacteriales bacterium CG_4_9_14_3_um_filter_40_17]